MQASRALSNKYWSNRSVFCKLPLVNEINGINFFKVDKIQKIAHIT